MANKYTLAHGAKHNVGDFLIRNRAIDLLTKFGDVREENLYFIDLVRSELTQKQFDKIKETDAVILAGGPGYQPDFYPGVYPDLNRILNEGIPFYPMGPGWKGMCETEYEFTEPSKDMLRRIHNDIEIGGARDIPTKRVVEELGIDNVKLTGCPAWHDLNRDQESFTPPNSIDSIVVSSPSRGSYSYGPQWIYLMYRLSKEFPNAEKYCSFHQGLGSGSGYNNKKTILYNKWIAEIARKFGFKIIDMGGKPELYEKYRQIDLHVGYRVHGHIPFLANGQPSFLIHQDGRGLGVSESLNTMAVDVSGFGRTVVKSPVDDILRNIKRNLNNGFKDFNRVDEALSEARNNMIDFIQQLP